MKYKIVIMLDGRPLWFVDKIGIYHVHYPRNGFMYKSLNEALCYANVDLADSHHTLPHRSYIIVNDANHETWCWSRRKYCWEVILPAIIR